MPLNEYQRKRKFEQTPEPSGDSHARPEGSRAMGGSFVVQKHDARRLHYDFRLEIGGALVSWAVPKGPSLNPADKRLAVQTEDHPLSYGSFEGVIPEGNYGAGPVIVWDNGVFEVEGELPAADQLARGEIKFKLHGRKLRGSFVLVRTKRAGEPPGKDWLLIKHRDDAVDPEWDIDRHDGSVLSGRTLADLEEGEEGGPGDLPGARDAPIPDDCEPELATLIEKPFSDPAWLFELKWDGMRALTWIRDGKIEMRSRRARGVTGQFPELADLAAAIRAKQAIVDGEVVALDERGRPDFGRMQQRMNVARPPASLVSAVPVVYYLFDILYCDGYDLRGAPLAERKEFLRRILEIRPAFRYSDHVAGSGAELFALSREQGLEGVIGKHSESKYEGGRNTCWVKLKATQEADAVIGGFTAPRGGREHFGALLVGLYRGGRLEFAGGVGSGFTQATGKQVWAELKERVTDRCPFTAAPVTREKAQWVDPSLVARVKFTQWTHEGHLRAPVFLGLRPDVDPADCRFENEQPAAAPAVRVGPPKMTREELHRELLEGRGETLAVEFEGRPLKLSHLNKVYFPLTGYRKRDLLRYYLTVADAIMPFLRGRPLVLRRRPEGMKGEMFYQKDAGEGVPEWMETHRIVSEETGNPVRFYVANDAAALLYLTNLGCIDHDPWSSTIEDLTRPDWIFFDLDPTDDTDFSVVVEVAREMHATLARIGMKPHLKTSGASGFHIYIPVERVYSFEQVRGFTEIVSRIVGSRMPELTTLERTVDKRPRGRVYLDYLQISYGRPLASVYSVRPVETAAVSAPVKPSELRKALRPERFHLGNMAERLAEAGDLWADFWQSRQRIEPALEKLSAEVRG